MKLLINPLLEQISEAISKDHGDTIVSCRIESYSCKMVAREKKMFKQLLPNKDIDIDSKEELSIPDDVLRELSGHDDAPYGSPYFRSRGMSDVSPSMLPSSSSAPGTDLLQHTCSTRTLYYLKATLNTAFAPDYDFSSAQSHEFSKEPSLDWIQRKINSRLSTVVDNMQSVMPVLWQALEKEICPSECDIYSYRPDMDSDPFGDDVVLWSFNYFLYNKKLKRIVFIRASAQSAIADSDSTVPGDEDELSEAEGLDMMDHMEGMSDDSFESSHYNANRMVDLSYMEQ